MGGNGVGPLENVLVGRDVDWGHLLVTDADSGLVLVGVESGSDLQDRAGRGGDDVVEDVIRFPYTVSLRMHRNTA